MPTTYPRVPTWPNHSVSIKCGNHGRHVAPRFVTGLTVQSPVYLKLASDIDAAFASSAPALLAKAKAANEARRAGQ